MEIAIAIFIGAWLSFFAIWSFVRLKKDYTGANAGDNENKEIGKKQ